MVNQIVLDFLAIGAFFAFFTCAESTTWKGKADAKADLAAGKLAIETAGLSPRWWPSYARLLRDRHGIELRSVGGCVLDDKTIQHMASYNAVMEAEISRRFGADALEKARAEAQRLGP